MKPTPKHLRPRWRYLAVEIDGDGIDSIDRGQFQEELRRSCRTLVGDVGVADADLRVFALRFDGGRGQAVVRTSRESVTLARSAVACVQSIDGLPVRVRVRGVSGTVRACEEKHFRR